MKKISIILAILLVFGSVVTVFGHGEGGTDTPTAADVPAAATDLTLSLRIPVLSPQFIETPVATVNGESIMLGEFSHQVSSAEPDNVKAEKFTQKLEKLTTAILTKQKTSARQIDIYVDAESIKDGTIVLKAPIFSPYFIETPVAIINGDIINFGDFAQQIISMYSGMADGEVASHDYGKLLERLISVELVVQEARNIGIHETEGAVAQISTFDDKALAKILLQEQSRNVTPVKAEVDEVYKLLSQEVKLITIQFKSEQGAQAFLEEYQKNEMDFITLAEKEASEGNATFSNEDAYVHINDLLPKIKTDITQMEEGAVSQIYKASANGFLLFKMVDRRFVEDETVYQDIQRRNVEKERQAKSLEYIETLEEKYVRYEEKVMKDLNFVQLKEETPDLDLRQYLQQLRDDQRTLVTFEGTNDFKVTVNEVAEKINASFYHGLEETVTADKLNEEKEKALYNLQFQVTSRLEATALGLDKDERYTEEVDKFITTLLFESFLEKVVAPEVSIKEDEIRQSYTERQGEFSSPSMLKMRSLVYETEKEAKLAYDRLKSGSDFKWVSTNSQGILEKDAEGVLPFESNLLSVTALPEGIQEQAASSVTGDVLLFADPGKYFYVLYVDAAYAPQPKAYESVRSQVGQDLYNQKFAQILDHWVSRLKEVYETETFLVKN